MSNRRDSDWGAMRRKIGKKTHFTAKEIREHMMSDYAFTDEGERLVELTQGTPEEYESNLREMLNRLQGKVKGVFLVTPYYIEPNREDTMRARMDEYCDICRALAEEYGCIFVDFQKMYEDFCKIRHSTFIAWDRVHPNQIGATLMAKEFLSHCGYEY
ncbi:MAG: hypothetical protein J6S41_00955, partial [Clostridia bacterium]|nr:hypothetical protein [Clostridia bacterium]